MSFAFGFSGDDIDASSESIEAHATVPGALNADGNAPIESVPTLSHDLESWLSSLPSSISYGLISIESPSGRTCSVPRRELFDICQQLMAEDDEDTLRDIETSDLQTNKYEGGFKTWECSIDLASLLLERGPANEIDELAKVDNVIELGAGSAIPTLVLFQHALQHSRPITFTLADFNSDVLRLVTLPNLLLSWAILSDDSLCADVTDVAGGELSITAELVQNFTTALTQCGINLHFVSGPWSPSLLDIIPPSTRDLGTLILASETIYSPASTLAFVDLVVQILKRDAKTGKAIVAAKRMYFGIGGSVDGLKHACEDQGALAIEIEESGVKGMDQGIGRTLVEVRMC